MSDLVRFVIDDLGYMEAWMGTNIVGIIGPSDYGEWTYKRFLSVHGAIPAFRHAESRTSARRQLLQWLAGWFVDAGPAFQSIADSITEQALRETEGEHV